MTLMINLPAEIVKKLETLAAASGKKLEEYAASLLTNQAQGGSAAASQQNDQANRYPLWDTKPYEFPDPFSPAIPDEEWEGS